MSQRDWEGAIKSLIFWAFLYALLLHPLLEWVCIILTAFSKHWWGEPIAVPTPQRPDVAVLIAASLQLATLAGVSAVKERMKPKEEGVKIGT